LQGWLSMLRDVNLSPQVDWTKTSPMTKKAGPNMLSSFGGCWLFLIE